jgi:hypothetical protein
LKSYQTVLTSVSTLAVGMEASKNQCNQDPVSADEIELLCIGLREKPADFSTPYDYLCNLMKSPSETASDALTHSIMTRKSSNETLPLVAGQPTVPKLRELFSSIMKKLRALDESALATLVKDHSESAADISATSNTQNQIDDSVAENQADDSSCILLKPTLIGEYYLSELYYYLKPFICASYSWILWCFEI